MFMVRRILAKIVFWLHISAILFLVFGCLFPRAFLLFHIVSIPIVIVQWWFNGDQCVLTQIQYWLEGRPIEKGEEGTFVKALLEKVGLQPSRTQTLLIVYGFILGSGLISGIRLWA